jgi:DNA-binding Lrp family transcriptional regulator
MDNIDALDRKILHALDADSRTPYSKIGKSLKLSPQFVKYRIESLYKRGILLHCWPMIGYRGIGYFFGLFFIKLHNMGRKEEKELFKYLNSHRYIPIVMRGQGYADLIIAIDGKGVHHLSQIIRELQNRFSRYFLDLDSVIPIGFSRFNRNYLVRVEEETPDVAFTGAPVKIELDEVDRKVLSRLNQDARIPTVQIARTVGIPYENAAKRLKRLEESGVIQCYTILPDHVKLGYPRYRTLIKFKNLTEKEERRFFTYCNLNPNIIHHLKVLGNWDLVIDIEVESIEKQRQIIMDIKAKFPEIIQRIEPTYIYKIDRFRDIPDEYPKLNEG